MGEAFSKPIKLALHRKETLNEKKNKEQHLASSKECMKGAEERVAPGGSKTDTWLVMKGSNEAISCTLQ